jgi:predicted O-linked N-acetylglucosamine transferase (SPINDLY family)/predicted SAM-dependent methyltransferase
MSLLSRLIARKPAPAGSAPDRETLDRWLREGYEQHVRGNLVEAERLYRLILEHDAGDADALFFLGVMAVNDRRELEAIDLFEKAAEARPNDAAFRFALGGTFYDLRRFHDAMAHFRAGLALQPDNINMAGNLWAAMIESDLDEEARGALERARSAGYDTPQINANLAGIYRNHARIEEAVAAYRRLLERVPDDLENFSNLLLTLNYGAGYTPAELFAEHQAYATRAARPYVAPPPAQAWPRKLRIGYVSPDFRLHVVAFFLEPIFAHHDREKFELYCYYTHRQDDQVTERLRAAADHWLDCVHMPDAELADRIRADRIDILIDLAGHTGHNRLRVFAMKPAPVQATYLGYPNTTGLAAIDYRISDARADPPGEADRLSAERIMRLPECFHCYRAREDSPPVGPLPAAQKGYVTFGCFNNFPKLSADFLEAAVRVLAAVPHSRLWLKAKALGVGYVAAGIRERFTRAGIDSQRVELSGWKPGFSDHLAAYGEVDIALDSFPYNGTTTTFEALWMGVPVVTLAGNRHAARVGVSILGAVGLDDLIANDVEELVSLCKELAGDQPRLSRLRAELRERVRRSPVMDEAGFTRALEQCYTQMWENKLRESGAASRLDPRAIAELARGAAEHRRAGRIAHAGEAYREILVAVPDHVEALVATWDISYETGNPGAAVDWLNRAISVRGNVAEFHYMLGCSLQAQGKVGDAKASFLRALEIEPGFAKAQNNLGSVLELSADLDAAAQCYRRAVELDPKLAVASYNLGNACRQRGELAQAIEHMQQAIALEPARADWNANLAECLYDRMRFDEAVASFRRALDVEPGFPRALSGLGLALQALGRAEEAQACFRQAVQLEPGFATAHSNLLLSLHYTKAEQRQAIFDEHVAWARMHGRVGWQAARNDEERRRPPHRLKVGYVSPDFQRHPVAQFIEPVLAAHERSRFHVFCYANVAAPDAVTTRMQGLCEHWRDISTLTDEQVIEHIRADKIDILVDLAGHTGGGRLDVFARKPAPVQVTWLGYPATTGLRAVDYRLTDAYADPPGESERFHTETLVRLPEGFLCYGPPPDAPEVSDPPSATAGYVTFGSFNSLSKLTPAMVGLWSQLLHALPEAKLCLKSYGLSAQSARLDVLSRFAEKGVGEERLRLLPPAESTAAHLARYSLVDIALDVHPYNGTTTTCEALWMGVPVVTLSGAAHASRVGTSILNRLGLAELVATTPEQYVDTALRLARDLPRLRELRSTMRERMRVPPLTDSARFTRALETVYHEIWERYMNPDNEPLRLHIGGTQRMPGWKILNVQSAPEVDYIGDCTDLSQFADESVEEIYGSHVLEHLGYNDKLPHALGEFHRVLKKGGCVKLSVPDFEVLCRLFLDPRHNAQERFQIMRMAFGGQVDPHDFHFVGLTFEFLDEFLRAAGFTRVERTGEFGLFTDTSSLRFSNVPISLNVIAYK